MKKKVSIFLLIISILIFSETVKVGVILPVTGEFAHTARHPRKALTVAQAIKNRVLNYRVKL